LITTNKYTVYNEHYVLSVYSTHLFY